jgi:hypothetical protein
MANESGDMKLLAAFKFKFTAVSSFLLRDDRGLGFGPTSSVPSRAGYRPQFARLPRTDSVRNCENRLPGHPHWRVQFATGHPANSVTLRMSDVALRILRQRLSYRPT